MQSYLIILFLQDARYPEDGGEQCEEPPADLPQGPRQVVREIPGHPTHRSTAAQELLWGWKLLGQGSCLAASSSKVLQLEVLNTKSKATGNPAICLFLHKNISTRKNKKRINRGSKLAAYKYQQIGSLALNHCSGSCLIWTFFGGIRIRSCNCRLQNPISFNNLKT